MAAFIHTRNRVRFLSFRQNLRIGKVTPALTDKDVLVLFMRLPLGFSALLLAVVTFSVDLEHPGEPGRVLPYKKVCFKHI